ncbi:helix-turn-helix transcriptional regulator [Actinokineospora terrae]|uniref:AraC-type DNA-binding protein n=1 Tax=Actinokineospora terrae TaxID=155974 RepID=A0A1H9LEH5_9PSEU|nr:AraC family transcriptional regulator [Actinokineospora terrae]SER09659.1 AraC-type DNA-binding protein [Actinokineospora terrae]
MDEYASARLVAAVRRGLAEAGIDTTAPQAAGALLPLDAKRRYLSEVAAAHGLLPLARAGSVLRELAADPAVSALSLATTPAELLDRWRRLERFTHSRHRVEARGDTGGQITVEHVGLAGIPPEPAEDAVVLGVLVALLGVIGVRGLSVAVGPSALVVFAGGDFVAPPPVTGSGWWRFEWTGTTARTPVAVPERSDVVTRVRGLLASDLGRRWSLAEVAALVGTSGRSLQRALRAAGGFQDLLGAARTEAAAGLLLAGTHPLSTIGFACGYADQPHFTREFTRRTAMSPAAYRHSFS